MPPERLDEDEEPPLPPFPPVPTGSEAPQPATTTKGITENTTRCQAIDMLALLARRIARLVRGGKHECHPFLKYCLVQ